MSAFIAFRNLLNVLALLRYGAVALSLGLLISTGGCGPKTPERVPVEGRVTFKGGNWPKAGIINFTCFEPAPGFPSKSGVGKFDVDGKYTAMTGEYPGLMPGTYRITISCWEKIPGEGFPGLSYLPTKFTTADQSGLELKIESGQSGPVVWDHDFPDRKK